MVKDSRVCVPARNMIPSRFAKLYTFFLLFFVTIGKIQLIFFGFQHLVSSRKLPSPSLVCSLSFTHLTLVQYRYDDRSKKQFFLDTFCLAIPNWGMCVWQIFSEHETGNLKKFHLLKPTDKCEVGGGGDCGGGRGGGCDGSSKGNKQRKQSWLHDSFGNIPPRLRKGEREREKKQPLLFFSCVLGLNGQTKQRNATTTAK